MGPFHVLITNNIEFGAGQFVQNTDHHSLHRLKSVTCVFALPRPVDNYRLLVGSPSARWLRLLPGLCK